MKLGRYARITAVLIPLVFGVIYAQVQAGSAKPRPSDDSKEETSSVSVESGIVGSDVEMIGTAIINGVVYIDGEKLPSSTSVFTSKKTGKTYLVKRGKNGNVSVVEK